ncbi:MAG: hypothetical protein DMG57_32035 [Acidobacteria bacterium]|nr:MAG: hypothetical protein DMG57_32035 [Acidobacteriota bacterium]
MQTAHDGSNPPLRISFLLITLNLHSQPLSISGGWHGFSGLYAKFLALLKPRYWCTFKPTGAVQSFGGADNQGTTKYFSERRQDSG